MANASEIVVQGVAAGLDRQAVHSVTLTPHMLSLNTRTHSPQVNTGRERFLRLQPLFWEKIEAPLSSSNWKI